MCDVWRIAAILLMLNELSASVLLAQSLVDEHDASLHALIGKKVQLYIDEPRSLSIDDVLHGTVPFQPSTTDAPTFNALRGAVWLKFSLSDDVPPHRILEFFYPLLDSVEVFGIVKTNSGKDSVAYHKLIGSMIVFSQREIQYSTLLFNLPSDLKDYYARITSTYSMQIIPRVMNDSVFHAYSTTRSLLHGLYFGFVVMIIGYSFFLWVGTKDSIYLYYILHVLATGLLLAHMNGYTNQLFWGGTPQINLLEPSIFGLAIFSTIFSIKFLRTKDTAPKLHRWLLAAVWLNALVFPLNLLGLNFWANQLVQAAALFGCSTMLTAGIVLYRQGYQPARFFVISWCVFLVGVFLTVFDRMGLVPHSNWTYHASQVGSALDIILLSLALADRINLLQQEKERAQKQLLKEIEAREALTRRQNELLEEKVKMRTEQILLQNKLLEQRKRQLEELIRTKDKLFSVIGHDLRNPISGIWQLSEFLGTSEQLTDSQKSTMRMITKTSQEALKLVEDILTWSRTLSISGASKKSSSNLSRVAEATAALLSAAATQKGIVIKTELAPDLILSIDENMVSTVIRNLISNAIKFTPKGGTIEVQTKYSGGNVVLQIKDTGIGMSEDMLQRIKQEKALPTTPGTEGEMGTGLGLLVCRDFVEHFGGEFEVDSELGKGSTFRIVFPAEVLLIT